jgi:hypothetical protein
MNSGTPRPARRLMTVVLNVVLALGLSALVASPATALDVPPTGPDCYYGVTWYANGSIRVDQDGRTYRCDNGVWVYLGGGGGV